MKVVIAPDKFAGTLTAGEAADAIAAGWSSARPDDELVLVPMADGGEGTIDVLARAVPDAEKVCVDVADARGRQTTAAWLRLPDGRALVEAAQACGLFRLPEADRDPLLATSYGVGQLIASALDAGARQIVVGLGGSATVDGGAGMATALGHRLLRADGNGVKVGGRFLLDLRRIVPVARPSVPVVAAVDVTNPLLGSAGAAPVFGPQKGAAPEDVPLLAEALRTLADVAERDLQGGPWRDLPGAGAAGGLGFALAAFCGATLVSGSEAVADLTGLPEALEDAAVAVTGEGKLDRQTAQGKTPAYVAQRARETGARVFAVAGQVADGADAAYDAVAALGPEGMMRAGELVRARAAELAERLREDIDR